MKLKQKTVKWNQNRKQKVEIKTENIKDGTRIENKRMKLKQKTVR